MIDGMVLSLIINGEMQYSTFIFGGEPSCTYKKVVSSKKDEIYSISSFLFIKNCIKRYKTEYLFTQKVEKCYDLELSFCHFPEQVGYELKR